MWTDLFLIFTSGTQKPHSDNPLDIRRYKYINSYVNGLLNHIHYLSKKSKFTDIAAESV